MKDKFALIVFLAVTGTLAWFFVQMIMNLAG